MTSTTRPTPMIGHDRGPTAGSATSTLIDASSPTNSRFPPHATAGSKAPHRTDGLPTPPSPTFVSEANERPGPIRREGTVDPSAFPSVIPPEPEGRTLVLCFDGTGDQFDSDNSNIVQLVSLLKKDDRTKQLVYYQTGIGTYTTPQVATPFMSNIEKTLDVMLAWNLHAHVMAGYEFLMQNYITGDKICLFGFSRGAYTARSLAGMLHKVGLLPAGNVQQVPFAYKMYTRADDIGWEQSNEFKKAFCVDVHIEFVGVWDTVDSVGLVPKRLPFTTSNTIVRTFRHALALDERRAKFKANLWNRPTAEEMKLGTKASTSSNPFNYTFLRQTTLDDPWDTDERKAKVKTGNESASGFNIFNRAHKTSGKNPDAGQESSEVQTPSKPKKRTARKEDEDDKKLNVLERIYSEKLEKVTDVEEVWFSGCHCDVGGGSVSNKTRHALARIPLRWMIRECFKVSSGIMFHSEKLLEIGLDPTSLYPYVAPRPPPLPVQGPHARILNPPDVDIPIKTTTYLKKKKSIPDVRAKADEQKKKPFLGSEEHEELRDAMSPKYDQLRLVKGWWTLELLPLRLRYQRRDNEWVSLWGSNMASPRYIPQQRTNGFKVHRSVKMRMEAEYEDEARRQRGKKYVPKPVWKVEPTWID